MTEPTYKWAQLIIFYNHRNGLNPFLQDFC